MNRYITYTVLSLSLMLSSCGLYSKYEGATSVDPALYGSSPLIEEGTTEESTMGDMSWQELFDDPQLIGYIEQALEQNSDMRSAELRVEQAESSLTSSRLAYLPSLSLSPQATSSGLVEGGAAFNTYTLPLSTSWEVDVFGRITNTKLKAKMTLEAQKYSTQAIRTELVAATANIYYTLSMLEQQIRVAEATEASWRESYEAAQAMMSVGMMDQAGVAQIKAGLYGVEIALETLRKSLRSTQNSMCSLLGIAPTQIEVDEISSVTLPSKFEVGVPLQMLSRRPDVMASEAALAASFYSENIARSAFYPTLSLSGSMGWSNSSGSAILDPAQLIYSVVGSLVQPIFNKGLNKAQLRIAKADLEIARIAFEQKLLDSGIEVNNALSSLETAMANASRYESQVSTLQTAVESTSLKMKHGSTTYLEVLTAQQTLFNAQLSLISNQFDQRQSLISLYKSLGGGRF